MQTSKTLGTISRRKSNQLKVTQRWQRGKNEQISTMKQCLWLHSMFKTKEWREPPNQMSRWKNHQGAGRNFGDDEHVCLLACGDGLRAHTAKPSKRTLLHTCRLFCVNYPLIKLLRGETQTGFLTPLCVKGVPVTCLQLKARSLRHPGLSASPIRTLAAPKANGPPPASLFSGTVLSRLTVARTNYSSQSICCSNPFPESTSHTSQNDHATQLNRSASMSPPSPTLPTTFCGYQEWAGQKREWRRFIWDQRLRGVPYHRQSLCSNVGRETLGTFFLYPVTVISDQT